MKKSIREGYEEYLESGGKMSSREFKKGMDNFLKSANDEEQMDILKKAFSHRMSSRH